MRQEKTNKKRKVDDTDLLLLSPPRTQNEEIHKKYDDPRLPFLKTILDEYRTDFPTKNLSIGDILLENLTYMNNTEIQ